VFFKNSDLCFTSYLGSIDFINEGEGWFGLLRVGDVNWSKRRETSSSSSIH
jgi:hypothetical protein